MGYSREHVEATRNRILEVAATLIRKLGAENVSVVKIMDAAGLTHGGFYAHFDSKQSLFEEVVGEDFDFYNQLVKLNENLSLSKVNRALVAADYYLDRQNSLRVADACTMASTSQEVARSGKRARAGFTRSFKRLVSEFGRASAAEDRPRAEQAQVLAALACCVGGLVLSRSLDDPELEEELLEAAKQNVAGLLEGDR